MNALLLTAPSRLELVDFPKPTVQEDEVLVRVRACGICGSDIHGWDGSSGRRLPPLIMGHEAAGEIAATGAGAEDWKPGDRVTFDSTIYCGNCGPCRSGKINLCENRRVLGVATSEYRQHGAFAEYVAVPARILHRLPASVPFEHAAMIEPVSVAIHAVRRVAIRREATVVVIGAGMIGLLIVQVLRWTGAARIIAVDLEPKRLALARELGANDTLRSGECNVAEEIIRRTSGCGADFVFEAVGLTPTVQLAINSVSRGGAVVLVGNLAPGIDFPLQAVVTREITVHGSCASAGEYPLCIDLIARGVIRVAPLISEVAPLRDGPSWFSRLSAPGGGQYLKVILQP